jgi:hypothetical protein
MTSQPGREATNFCVTASTTDVSQWMEFGHFGLRRRVAAFLGRGASRPRKAASCSRTPKTRRLTLPTRRFGAISAGSSLKRLLDFEGSPTNLSHTQPGPERLRNASRTVYSRAERVFVRLRRLSIESQRGFEASKQIGRIFGLTMETVKSQIRTVIISGELDEVAARFEHN